MPRMMRLEAPGSLVHCMSHGIDGTLIFSDDEDREMFLEKLSFHIRECAYQCLAWCLMDNHYHLLLRTNEKPTSAIMRPLNGGYARWFNKKHNRRGYLFQDRFKSIICQEQEYARKLIRYIHLNPLRAGKVQSLDDLLNWKWCSHGYLLGKQASVVADLQTRKETLRRFGRNEKEAIDAYLSYLSDGIDTKNLHAAGMLPPTESFEISGSQKGWPAIIGDPEFVRTALARHEIGLHRKHRQADYFQVLEENALRTCKKYTLQRNDLFHRGRKSALSEARAHFCYQVHFQELLPLSVIARFLKISIPAVRKLSKRGKGNAAENY